MPKKEELFGSPDQMDLMRRGRNLWALLHDNPLYSYYGRMVSLSNPGGDAIDQVSALARLQGATSCQYYPATEADRFCADLENQGISTSRYEQHWGGETALAASRRLIEEHSLPKDLTVITVDSDTTPEQVADIAGLSLDCGVMPVPGSAMRWLSRKGICLAAMDPSGLAVATASSYISNHPSSPRSNDAFWGMLATREDRRGERIALHLGAQAIISMREKHDARAFTTSVKADNSSSMSLCHKLGVTTSDWVFIGCIDPETFGDGSITR